VPLKDSTNPKQGFVVDHVVCGATKAKKQYEDIRRKEAEEAAKKRGEKGVPEDHDLGVVVYIRDVPAVKEDRSGS
jgi:hypothetical protein